MRKWKYFILTAFLTLTFLMDAQKKNVTLELIYYEPYCGGARPTEEIEAEARKPKPYAKQKLILLSKNGKVDSLFTDEKGRIKVKLKKGEYTLFEYWRYQKGTFNSAPLDQFDQECLKNEWIKPLAQIKILNKKTKIEFKHELINYCDWALPCLLETHMPPMRE